LPHNTRITPPPFIEVPVPRQEAQQNTHTVTRPMRLQLQVILIIAANRLRISISNKLQSNLYEKATSYKMFRRFI